MVVLDVGVFGEVGGLVRELASRRRDELAYDTCGRLLLREGQSVECSLHVFAHNRACAAELVERGEPKLVGIEPTLALPQPLEHELEIGRLDPVFGRRLIQHVLHQRVLRRELLSAQLAVAGERPEDRRPAGVTVEPVESEEVPEQLGDPTGELVEFGERVVA